MATVTIYMPIPVTSLGKLIKSLGKTVSILKPIEVEAGGTHVTTETELFLQDLIGRRQDITVGTNAINTSVELNGGRMIEIYENEPDPNTFRDSYYYNSKLNRLYKRTEIFKNRKHGIIRAKWTTVSST